MMMFSILKRNKLWCIPLLAIPILFILNYQITIFRYLFPSKVWSHRVNSIEKYQEANVLFSGVELDVVYDHFNDSFDVNHPPAKSIGLSLFKFLKSKSDYSDFGIWLDFKNLDELNCEKSAIKLYRITKALNINPQNIIVESNNSILLGDFLKKGFRTSYYLPFNISGFSEDHINIQKLLINTSNVDYISSDVGDYNFLKKHFKEIKVLTWIINNPPKIKNLYTLKRSLINFFRNFKVLNDEKVNVVLFKFSAIKGNR